jgi:hypothetical protein
MLPQIVDELADSHFCLLRGLLIPDKLSVTREYFNNAMGLTSRKKTSSGARAKDDDDGVNEKCTCQWRDPADAPKPNSKQALAESAAGKSFNCGEDCHNNLLMVECTEENCNLTALGRGEKCNNRKFTKVDYFPGVEPFKTEFKGWGVQSVRACGPDRRLCAISYFCMLSHSRVMVACLCAQLSHFGRSAEHIHLRIRR